MTLSTTKGKSPPRFGDMLRDWRARRRLSQLELAMSADVSARHISFLETGRARPSRAMVLRLAEVVDAPLAERNEMLEAAGFAAAYSRAPLDDETLEPVRDALARLMHNHMPYPALLFTRQWDVVAANESGQALFNGSPEGANAIELLLADEGLRHRILNLGEVLHGMVSRLRAESRLSGGDQRIDRLVARLIADPALAGAKAPDYLAPAHPFLLVRVRHPAGELALFTATAELGTAWSVTLRDLHLELFSRLTRSPRRPFEAVDGAKPA